MSDAVEGAGHRPSGVGAWTIARARTAAWRLLMLLHPHPKLWELHRRGRLRAFDPLLRRGRLLVPGGLAPNTWLSAAHFEPWSAQALGVLTGTHEPMVQEALRRTLPRSGVLIDVGANVGATSLVAARLVGASGAVVALDPQPECVAALRANAALNGYRHLSVVQAAAGAASGTAEMIVVADSLWTRLASVGEHALEARRERVRVVTLDELVGSGQAPEPDVIKVDVEGAELDVVAGMRRLLERTRPVVICEMHGRNGEFTATMEGLGYRVVNLGGPEPVPQAEDNVHALCEPVEAR